MFRDGVVTGTRSCDYGGTLGTITGPLAGVAAPTRPGRWAVMDESEQLGTVASCHALRAPPALTAPTCESMRVMHAGPGRIGRRRTELGDSTPSAWAAPGRARTDIVGLENTVRWGSVPRTARCGVSGWNVRFPVVGVDGPGEACRGETALLLGRRPEYDTRSWLGLRTAGSAANRPARSRPSQPTVSYPGGETPPLYYNTAVRSIHR